MQDKQKNTSVNTGQFLDNTVRGKNGVLFNASLGLAAMEIGIPGQFSVEVGDNTLFQDEEWDITNSIINIQPTIEGDWPDLADSHPIFDFDPENFTLFSLNLNTYWQELQYAFGFSELPVEPHLPAFYEKSIASELGLPDLPWGETAHFLHIIMGFYNPCRTFLDLWEDPNLHHNFLKIATHPQMIEDTIASATMLTTMAYLHPLGAIISIGVAHLAVNLVHFTFGILEGNRDTIKAISNIPIIGSIFALTGLQAWAEHHADICELRKGNVEEGNIDGNKNNDNYDNNNVMLQRNNIARQEAVENSYKDHKFTRMLSEQEMLAKNTLSNGLMK